MKIIFVCLGNICRSPMAECVMRALLSKADLSEKVTIESRATSEWEHGNPIHPETIRVLQEHKIPIDPYKRSQQMTPKDFLEADQIFAMDQDNLTELSKMAPSDCRRKIHLLLDQSIPDPWYTGDFETTYQLVKKGCEQLLSEISEQ